MRKKANGNVADQPPNIRYILECQPVRIWYKLVIEGGRGKEGGFSIGLIVPPPHSGACCCYFSMVIMIMVKLKPKVKEYDI